MKKGNLIALLLCIVTPLLLSFLFLTLLTSINWTQMTGGAPQILAILSFSSIAFGTSVPIFGWGYVIPLFIWIITGILVGLFCKSAKKAAALTLVGIVNHAQWLLHPGVPANRGEYCPVRRVFHRVLYHPRAVPILVWPDGARGADRRDHRRLSITIKYSRLNE
jgi:hypothetical protein